MLTIDSSVIVSSFLKHERYHKQAKEFLNKLFQKGETILLPEIVLPEVASAIARGTRNPEYAMNFCRELRKFPNFIFIPIDESIAEIAVGIAGRYFLKGADSIWVAVAYKYGVELATFDEDQKKKGSKIVKITNVE